VELAGEIGAAYNSSNRSKQITLVHSGSHLLSAYPDIKEAVGENLRHMLQKQLYANVLLNDAVNVPESLLSSKELYIDQPTRLLTKNGQQLDADVVIYTIGGLPNTQFLRESQSFPASAFDGRGHIKVNDYLQVTAGDMKYSNIYAIGDAASYQPGLAFWVGGQATWLAKHLHDISHGKAIESTKPMKKGMTGAMMLPLGANLGGGQLPLFGGWRIGSTLTRMMKGKDLFTSKNKAMLKLK
jgi:NADH dehydrogenase FAD-containing subunit